MLSRIIRLFSPGPRSIDDILVNPEGKRYYRNEHNLRRDLMDQDALKVINRLNRHGYRSYLVGGCVRDMILKRRPKDFDVVTTATPGQIRKLFSNSRTIGRRFKIVHVVFRGKIIEVSTFRSLPSHRLRGRKAAKNYMLRRDNHYGTPREDAARRDFSINGLYFDPRNESIIDYLGGFEDILNSKISIIGDPDMSFKEDPVRMLRAAKFAALLNFTLDQNALKSIRRNKQLITRANPSRLLEEYSKIFRTGCTATVFNSFYETGLLKALFPAVSNASGLSKSEDFYSSLLGKRLEIADKMLKEREDLTTNIFLALIFTDLVTEAFEADKKQNIIDYIKTKLDPVFKSIHLPGKDKDRLIQVYGSQGRFWRTGGGRRRFNPEMFRKKIFFYESFMVFKINAIAVQNDNAIQKAMFWEIGPRSRPPESGKTISLFSQRNKYYSRDRTSENANRSRSGRKDSKN